MRFSGFPTRAEAGRLLAERVVARHFAKPVVLALPRGGVPVAAELALSLKAPLDLILVRKIGVPWQKELAAAAVVDGERGDIVYNDSVMAAVGLGRAEVDKAAAAELAEIERRRAAYLKDRQPLAVAGRTAIVVDDGIATGTTVRAALIALRRRKPAKLVLAVPVAPSDTMAELTPLVDEIICLEQPRPFIAIGLHYHDFHQMSDAEVVAELARVPLDPAAG
jgi:putative phosphoribosyl transferase